MTLSPSTAALASRLELLERCLATVELALSRNNGEEALAAIERMRDEAAEPVDVTLESPLVELGLPLRIVHPLEAIGVLTVEDVTLQTPSNLRRLRNFGTSAVRQIREALAEHGWSLTPDEPELPWPPRENKPGPKTRRLGWKWLIGDR